MTSTGVPPPRDGFDVEVTRNEIGYFARCRGFESCQGLGETPEEAVACFLDALERYAGTLPPAERRKLLSRTARTVMRI